MKGVARGGLLVLLWLLAWGEFSLANLASGALVASGLLAAFPVARRSRPGVHPDLGGIVRLAWYVVGQLVISNLVMTREIIRRRTNLSPGVLAHPLAFPSDVVIAIMTGIISLSPGTMTADIDAEGATLYVHFLFLRDTDAARAGLVRLESLVAGAVGATRPSPEAPR
jgi:multicomponent Na+:H+ antiporter subunit E